MTDASRERARKVLEQHVGTLGIITSQWLATIDAMIAFAEQSPPTGEVVCPSCDGTGVDLYDGNADRDCTVCNGRKVVASPRGNTIDWKALAIDAGLRIQRHKWRNAPELQAAADAIVAALSMPDDKGA